MGDIADLAGDNGTSMSLPAGWGTTPGQPSRSAQTVPCQSGICMRGAAEFAAYYAHSERPRYRQIEDSIELSTLRSQPGNPSSLATFKLLYEIIDLFDIFESVMKRGDLSALRNSLISSIYYE